VRCFNQRPNNLCHTVGRRAGRKEPDIFAGGIHEEDKAEMVDARIRPFPRVGLGEIDLVGVRNAPDLLRVSG
jgi:hypothetical protein